MTRIKRLLQQLDTVEQMLHCRIQTIESAHMNALCYQIESVHQKVSLAEKRQQVKNGCSPITSVNR